MQDNRDLVKLVADLRAALETYEAEGKLVRSATMKEAANILVTK